MVRIGYALSSEEFGPNELVRFAVRAEEAGFEFAKLSDHYLPWVESQGQSPFAWAVLGAIAHSTSKLEVGTGVTCPIIRYHPALVAQMAATIECMMPGRFILGVGAGEFLNEHIYGDAFPPPDLRHEMLVEAIDIMRTLWQGGFQQYHGNFYEAQEARIYTLPDKPPRIQMAADGPQAARTAAACADGLIMVKPDADLVRTYRDAGGEGPIVGQVTVCYAASEQEAKRIAHEAWPNSALEGQANWDIRSTRLFDGLVKSITEDQVAQTIICGPDPEEHLQAIQKFADAGFDQVYVHQVGKEQEGFFRFYEQQIIPQLRGVAARH